MANTSRKQLITEFMKQHSPSPISNTMAQDLDCPLSEKEAKLALKLMKPDKSPGLDGLTLGYYKTYTELLLPFFLFAYNSFASPLIPLRHVMTAHFTVIPKPGKDSSLVTNYRPISLLNVDPKWYAKTLAIHLLPLLPQLISLDQVGFIPGREAKDNTLKVINVHHWLTSNRHQGFLLSFDVEKTFDRVAWDYMAYIPIQC